MALAQDDLKRLLAYSSVSQIGYVVVGIGLGTYLGCYGGLFHLLNHALYQGAAVHVRRRGDLRHRDAADQRARRAARPSMPITSACFVVGALAIAGLPPFNGFLSKLTVYLALAKAGMWWAVAIAIAAGVLTMVVLLRAARTVFWGTPPRRAARGPRGAGDDVGADGGAGGCMRGARGVPAGCRSRCSTVPRPCWPRWGGEDGDAREGCARRRSARRSGSTTPTPAPATAATSR